MARVAEMQGTPSLARGAEMRGAPSLLSEANEGGVDLARKAVTDVPLDSLDDTPRSASSAASRTRRGLLGHWSPAMLLVIAVQFINQMATAVVLGALFDSYLLVLHGSNTFVGKLETARGLSALAMAVPLGWVIDSLSKPRVLRLNLVLGLVAVALLAAGIPTDNTTLILAGVVAWAVHNQCLFGLFPPLLSEMTEAGNERMRVFGHLATAGSAGLACGPGLQLLLMVATHTCEWSIPELHWVLCSGLLLFLPYVPLVWCVRKNDLRAMNDSDSFSSNLSGSRGSGREQLTCRQATLDGALSPRRRWAVAILVEVSSIITAVGSGMTFKYWPLFFKEDFGFSPQEVCAIQLAIWCSISVSAQLSPKLARGMGRAPACLLLHAAGVALLFLISLREMPAALTVIMVLLRNGLMNALTPLVQSIVMDMVPHKHRGKWSSIASLRRMTWSGSAFAGGLLSDSHSYRFAFFVTACTHSVAGVFLVVVAILWP